MTRGLWRSAAASLAVLLAAFAAFHAATRGFSAVTADGVRRADIAQHPRALPALRLIDASGAGLSLATYGQAGQRATLVALQYVRCRSVCLTSASAQSWLHGQIQARQLAQELQLLTLSFDPANDTPEVLADHARRLQADPGLWRFATVAAPQDLPRLLQLFGIVVIPDGLGGYSHNAALFLIDRSGRLSRAYDIDRPDLALADYLASRPPPG